MTPRRYFYVYTDYVCVTIIHIDRGVLHDVWQIEMSFRPRGRIQCLLSFYPVAVKHLPRTTFKTTFGHLVKVNMAKYPVFTLWVTYSSQFIHLKY